MQGGVNEEEAIDVLKRALGMLKDLAADFTACGRHPGSDDPAAGAEARARGGGTQEGASSKTGGDTTVGDGLTWEGRIEVEGEVTKQTGTVLDTLSEVYARRRSWEQARCASSSVEEIFFLCVYSVCAV